VLSASFFLNIMKSPCAGVQNNDMKLPLIITGILFFLFSCQKEDDYFIDKYQSLCGTWMTQNILIDSAGIKINLTSPYDKLEIKKDLTYKIYFESTVVVEDGRIEIISQTRNKLELFFDPQYPLYSSMCGSHIFGISTVRLISLSDSQLVLKAMDNSYHNYPEFCFVR